MYSRESNPTRSRAEEVLGRIASDTDDEPAHAVLYSSGYAISVIVSKLSTHNFDDMLTHLKFIYIYIYIYDSYIQCIE